MGRRALELVSFGVCATTWLATATRAHAEQVCGTVSEFNAEMASAGTSATEVTLTFDVVGVNPNDFPGTKGSLAQFRDTMCGTGADIGIKVYGPDDPPNEAHPPGTLKMEYGNTCCGGTCGENWADPNPSATVFVDGTETCNVTMWVNATEVGYSLACSVGQFDALGGNPEANAVNEIVLLDFLLPDGGNTWALPNATASNDQVCWESVPTSMDNVRVPVIEDVATGPAWPASVFPDVTDLAVEADGTMAYLKFDVPAIEGLPTRLRLFMQVSTAPSSDGDGGEIHHVLDNSWSEATMTYDTRPAYEAASLGRIGPGAASSLLSVELDAALATEGLHTFAVFSPPTDGNGTHFWSKEGLAAGAAYLEIDYMVGDGDGDGTPAGPDCDDTDPAVFPDAEEACNGVDDDCDDMIDEGCPGDGSGGGESGGIGTSDGGLEGSGNAASGAADGSAGLPPGRGAGDTSCGCTSDRDAPAWAWLLVGLGGLARRRRR